MHTRVQSFKHAEIKVETFRCSTYALHKSIHFVLQKTDEDNCHFSEYYTKPLYDLRTSQLFTKEPNFTDVSRLTLTHTKPCYGNSVQVTSCQSCKGAQCSQLR